MSLQSVTKLQVSTKKPAACYKQWQKFHAKVLDASMVSLPEHASSDFVAELSELMLDSAWWDAAEAKHVELLHDRAGGCVPPTLMAAEQPQIHPRHTVACCLCCL